jgi:DNA polymerase III delta prime subunit
MTLAGHSFVVAGTADAIGPLREYLEREGVAAHGSADVLTRVYTFFGVEEARELRERAMLAAHGAHRVFIIAAPSLTTEAQNALLKTLEEPAEGTLFFIIVPSPSALLPTLRSRVQLLEIAHEPDAAIDVGVFLGAGGEARLKMLAPLLEKGEDDKRDMASILTFLSSLERRLAKRPEALEAIYRARKFSLDKGALLKPLLEQVALLVPRV